MKSFADIASTKIADVERPPLPPVGTYRFTITKQPEITSSKDDKWDMVTFSLRALEALDDVDMTDYKGEVTGITDRLTFVFNKEDDVAFAQTQFRLRTFLESHLATADPTDTLAQALNNSVNGQFLGTISHRARKDDPEDFQTQVSRTAPVE